MVVTIASMGGGAQTCTAALLGIRWPEGDAPSIPRSSDRLGPAGCCPLDAGIRYNPPVGCEPWRRMVVVGRVAVPYGPYRLTRADAAPTRAVTTALTLGRGTVPRTHLGASWSVRSLMSGTATPIVSGLPCAAFVLLRISRAGLLLYRGDLAVEQVGRSMDCTCQPFFCTAQATGDVRSPSSSGHLHRPALSRVHLTTSRASSRICLPSFHSSRPSCALRRASSRPRLRSASTNRSPPWSAALAGSPM